MKTETGTKMSLCYRCEHRACFLETGRRPRCECGNAGASNYSCYMYEPVKPVVLEPNENEKRDLRLGWLLSGRAHPAVSETCGVVWKLVCQEVSKKKRTLVKYWIPEVKRCPRKAKRTMR